MPPSKESPLLFTQLVTKKGLNSSLLGERQANGPKKKKNPGTCHLNRVVLSGQPTTHQGGGGGTQKITSNRGNLGGKKERPHRTSRGGPHLLKIQKAASWKRLEQGGAKGPVRGAPLIKKPGYSSSMSPRNVVSRKKTCCHKGGIFVQDTH